METPLLLLLLLMPLPGDARFPCSTSECAPVCPFAAKAPGMTVISAVLLCEFLFSPRVF
jgi:hypothetical protein